MPASSPTNGIRRRRLAWPNRYTATATVPAETHAANHPAKPRPPSKVIFLRMSSCMAPRARPARTSLPEPRLGRTGEGSAKRADRAKSEVTRHHVRFLRMTGGHPETRARGFGTEEGSPFDDPRSSGRIALGRGFPVPPQIRIAGPFPNVADDVVETEGVGREATDRRGTDESVFRPIDLRKAPLPNVGSPFPAFGPQRPLERIVVAPGPCRELPLRFGGK